MQEFESSCPLKNLSDLSFSKEGLQLGFSVLLVDFLDSYVVLADSLTLVTFVK